MKIHSNALQRLIMSHKLNEKWIPGIRGYHNAAGCILMAADTNRFNLQLRSSGSDTPNTWGMWGGSCDNNEEQGDTVIRELQEETGYNGPVKLFPLYVFRDMNRGFVYYNFLGVVPEEFTLKTNSESAGTSWFKFPNWPGDLHPGLKTCLNDKYSYRILECAAQGVFGGNLL